MDLQLDLKIIAFKKQKVIMNLQMKLDEYLKYTDNSEDWYG